MADAGISNVSDTARWVAAYRAQESARPDAIFTDPYAERLAGDRGRAIAAGASKRMHRGWSIVARTKLIDDLVLASVAEGCDRVINLAAGLDSRPYRLPLPASLTWVEADLPGILDEKERILARESPVCRLVRERVDLADPAARAALIPHAIGPALRALVITEGLLIYLEPKVVEALARELGARQQARWWLLDLLSPRTLQTIGKGREFSRAPLRFAPPNGVALFEAFGWRARDVRPLLRAAAEYRRAPWFLRPFALFPDPNPRSLARKHWAAVVRLERRRTGGGQSGGHPSASPAGDRR